MPEIIFLVRIASWNFVRVPRASLWAHIQSFSLKFAVEVQSLQCSNFERISWRARETLVKQPTCPSQIHRAVYRLETTLTALFIITIGDRQHWTSIMTCVNRQSEIHITWRGKKTAWLSAKQAHCHPLVCYVSTVQSKFILKCPQADQVAPYHDCALKWNRYCLYGCGFCKPTRTKLTKYDLVTASNIGTDSGQQGERNKHVYRIDMIFGTMVGATYHINH